MRIDMVSSNGLRRWICNNVKIATQMKYAKEMEIE